MTPVNLMNFRMERTADGTDWILYGDIMDDANRKVGSFGPDGASLNQWWVRQDNEFLESYVIQFAFIIAGEIVRGAAE